MCSRSRPVTSTALSGPGQLRQQPCRWAACLRARGARGRSAAPSLQLRLRAGAGTGASASVTPVPRWTRLGVSACRDPAPSRQHHPPQSPWHPRRGPAGAPCRHSEGQGVPVCLPVEAACARAGERAHHRGEFALVQVRGPSLSCLELAPVFKVASGGPGLRCRSRP